MCPICVLVVDPSHSCTIYKHAQLQPQPDNKLTTLGVKNCHTGEMCRNLAESLMSGRLTHLESLALTQVRVCALM